MNEVIRRFEVIDDRIELKEQVEIIAHFTTQLKNSGYDYKQSREIVICALKGITRKMKNRVWEKKRCKSSKETLEDRIQKKLLKASN